MFAVWQAPALAQDESERIVVTGSRIQRSGMETPIPVTAVSDTELSELNPGQLVESLSALPQFFNNQRPQTTGFPSSAGSNLNLRGLGANRTLVLLDERRLPNGNRFGTVNVGILPEGAIETVETVTGGASAAYGTDAVAGVVNFILDKDFEGFEGHAQFGVTDRGDGDSYEVAGTYGAQLGERGHVILSADHFNQDAIWSLESLQDRDWFRQRALVANPDPTGPTFITRDFVSQTNMSVNGVINQPGSALDKLEFFNENGTIVARPLAISPEFGPACNCQAEPTRDPTWGMDADNAIQNENERSNLFAYGEYDLTNDLRVYAQGIYGNARVKGPWFSNFILIPPVWQPQIFSGNPYLPADVQAIMDDEALASFGMGIVGSNVPENPLGQYTIEQEDELKAVTLGFEQGLNDMFRFGGFFNDVRVRGYAEYGENQQIQRFENGARMDRLPLALDAVTDPDTGQPACRAALANPALFGDCVPINLFGGSPSISPEAAAYVTDEEKIIDTTYKQVTAEFIIDGELHQGWGAGPVLFAAGVSYRKDSIYQYVPNLEDEFVFLNGVNTGFRGLIPEDQPNGIPGVRPGSVPFGFFGPNNLAQVLFTGSYQTPDTILRGSFNVPEGFVELNVPIVSDLPFAQQVDTSFSFRRADYSGSGGINAWKYGVNWEVNDDLRFRATSSRDVRAASLRERFDATAGGAQVNDPEFATPSEPAGPSIGTASRSGGNPNVSPEEADTVTAGVIYQPSFFEGFSVSVDWYSIDIQGALGQLPFQDIVDGCFRGSAELCQFVIRDSSNQIVRIDSLFLNLDSLKSEGIDVELRYSTEMAGGDVDLRLFATHLIEQTQQAPGDIVQELHQELPQDRVTASLGYSRGPVSASVIGRYIGSHDLRWEWTEGVNVDDNSVESVFYTDLNLQYDFEDGDRSWGVYANVSNVFDEAPPQTPTNPGFVGGTAGPDPTLYDTIGRTFTVGARVRF